MIHFFRLTDPSRIEKILKMDDLWKDMNEDHSSFNVIVNDAMWYFPIFEDKELVGIGVANWLGNKLVSWHHGMLKKHRGPESYKYAEAVLDSFPEDITHITLIPSYKENTIKFSKKLGFKLKTTFKDAVEKDNIVYDKLLLQRDR
jgi:hypothetical protein